jgi:hypothetical protein
LAKKWGCKQQQPIYTTTNTPQKTSKQTERKEKNHKQNKTKEQNKQVNRQTDRRQHNSPSQNQKRSLTHKTKSSALLLL